MPDDLAKALLAFHQDPPHISLDSQNPHFHSRFASLAGVMKSVRAPLAAVGVVVVQEPCALDSGMPALRTTLLHESGDQMVSVMPLAVEKPGPQAQGSALTYARRFAVLAVLGLVGDDDDDANNAEPAKAAVPAPPPRNKEASSPSPPAGAATSLSFGKHKGIPLDQVPSAYLEWVRDTMEPKTSKMEAEQQMVAAFLSGEAPDPDPPSLPMDEDIPF